MTTMTSAGVRAFHQTSEEDPERERIRDLSRFVAFGHVCPTDHH